MNFLRVKGPSSSIDKTGNIIFNGLRNISSINSFTDPALANFSFL